jgi:hypothetical protein
MMLSPLDGERHRFKLRAMAHTLNKMPQQMLPPALALEKQKKECVLDVLMSMSDSRNADDCSLLLQIS